MINKPILLLALVVLGLAAAPHHSHAQAWPTRPVKFIAPFAAGGTMMGADPGSSVLNRYLQSWDADNLFVMGASVFPQNQSYNPTGFVGALAYWSANAITTQYLKRPGPLI